MMEEQRDKLPLELLKEKYIPVDDYPEKYGIPVAVVMRLIKERKIRRAEFKVPGQHRRTLHANYEEVLREIDKEKIE